MAQLPPPLSALERRLGLPLGGLAGTERARAEDALADASALVYAEVPADVAQAWEQTAPAVASIIAVKAARREFENPRGFTQTGAADTTASVLIASGVYLTNGEISQLQRAAGTAAKFVGSIRTPSAYE